MYDFGICGTKRNVRIIEVSVTRGLTVFFFDFPMNVAGGNPCPPALNNSPVQGMSKADANVWRSFRCLSIQLRSHIIGFHLVLPIISSLYKFFPCKQKVDQSGLTKISSNLDLEIDHLSS